MAPPVVVVMGVMGAGKTHVAAALGARLGWPIVEGDDRHPPASIARMRAGHPLDDADREPWLASLADWIAGRTRTASPGIVTCSALRRRYRDRLRLGQPAVWFAWLDVPADELRRRVATRRHAYMPASLLDSQLAALEPLEPDEPGLAVRADRPIEAIVTDLVAALAARDPELGVIRVAAPPGDVAR